MTRNKIPVIYILSNGRSGSTLLDLLLGTHPNIWTLGEAQNLPWELRTPGTLCGCGVLISDCGFWQSICSNIPINQGAYPIEYFREARGRGKVLRWNLLPGLLRGKASKLWQGAVDEYGKVNAEYFRVVWQAAEQKRGTEIRWLVDASKDPYRLFWMQQSGQFGLRVIHLIKDPRAFVYSMVRPFLSYACRRAMRMTGRWLVENIIASRLGVVSFRNNQMLLLHYEELANHPEATMTRIGEWIGLHFSVSMIESFRRQENHGVAGNATRWQDSQIHLDQRWRTSLPRRYACLIQAVTWPVGLMFGWMPIYARNEPGSSKGAS